MSRRTGPGFRPRCSGPWSRDGPAGDRERHPDRPPDLRRTRDLPRPAGRGKTHPDRIRLLEGVGSELGARHLPGDRDEGGRVHEGIGEGGEEVGGAGPGSPHAHPGPAGRPGVAFRGVSRSLLVPHEHVADPIPRAEERVVNRHVRAPRIPEHEVHALGDEGFHQQLRSVPGPGRGSQCSDGCRPWGNLVRRARRKVRTRPAGGRFDGALVFGLGHFLTHGNEKARPRFRGRAFVVRACGQCYVSADPREVPMTSTTTASVAFMSRILETAVAQVNTGLNRWGNGGRGGASGSVAESRGRAVGTLTGLPPMFRMVRGTVDRPPEGGRGRKANDRLTDAGHRAPARRGRGAPARRGDGHRARAPRRGDARGGVVRGGDAVERGPAPRHPRGLHPRRCVRDRRQYLRIEPDHARTGGARRRVRIHQPARRRDRARGARSGRRRRRGRGGRFHVAHDARCAIDSASSAPSPVACRGSASRRWPETLASAGASTSSSWR